MAFKSGFFDAVETSPGVFDREYNAKEFTDFFSTIIDTGVLESAGEELKVTTDGAFMTTDVGTGIVFMDGGYARNKELVSHEHDAEALGLNRIDRIVVRHDLNLEARHIKSFVIKGIPSVNPIPPALTRVGDIYELSLAQVLIKGGQNFITSSDITDERGNETLCPWATSKILPDTTVIIKKLMDDIDNFKNFINATQEVTLKRVDKVAYDSYALWLEMYYKGLISHVDASGAKAIMMDGFGDTDNVESSSIPLVDSDTKLVNAGSTSPNRYSQSISGSTRVSSGSSYAIGQSFKGVGTLRSIKVYLENNETTGGGRNYALYEGDPTSGLSDFSGLTRLSNFKLLSAPYASADGVMTQGVATYTLDTPVVLNPSKTYLIISSGNTGSGDRGGWGHFWRHSNNIMTSTYGKAWLKNSSWGEINGRTFAMELIGDGVGFLPFNSAIFSSKQKSLIFTPIKAKLYLSVKEPSGTSVIPSITSNGSLYETCVLISSRPDPKFSGYTEKEYEVTFVNQGQVLGFKAAMNATTTTTPEIKRYGIILQ